MHQLPTLMLVNNSVDVKIEFDQFDTNNLSKRT
jgi:hypothetical protein